MRFVVAASAVEKERSDAVQDFATLGVRAVLDDIFQFRDQRKVGAHIDNRETSRRFFTVSAYRRPITFPEQPLQRFQ